MKKQKLTVVSHPNIAFLLSFSLFILHSLDPVFHSYSLLSRLYHLLSLSHIFHSLSLSLFFIFTHFLFWSFTLISFYILFSLLLFSFTPLFSFHLLLSTSFTLYLFHSHSFPITLSFPHLIFSNPISDSFSF